MNWQSKDNLINLLTELVKIKSITGSKEELTIADYIYLKLKELDYFDVNPEHISLNPIDDGRKVISALVKGEETEETLILLSHYDVVDIEDYGDLKRIAFHPQELTKYMVENKSILAQEVQEDIENGEWLFGRGIMDMKPGIALHMAMLEKACQGEFKGNILMLSVPDEEVNSAGMRGAVPILTELAQKYNLSYKTCLNSEPMFSKFPGDKNFYLYTGSIGKVLPGFLCYGKETHVGEPFSGLNATLMASEISKAMELNTSFCEGIDGENTSPPTCLMLKDLKEDYSVQIPHVSTIIFNVLLMKRSVSEVTEMLLEVAKGASNKIEDHYFKKAKAYASFENSYSPKKFNITVMTYDELKLEGINRYGKAEINRRQEVLKANFANLDEREFTAQLVSDLASLMKDKAPMIILYYSPPYYPAVCSSDNSSINKAVRQIQEFTKANFGVNINQQHYFPGMSDLSYTGLLESEVTLKPLINNMPLFNNGYHFPINELQELNIPVVNIGPLGRDAHKWTERLETSYSFGTLMKLLPYSIHQLFEN